MSSIGRMMAAVCMLAAGVAGAQDPEDTGTVPASKVLSEMHLMNRIELEAARLAEERAADGEVRDYAERLRKDHAFADEKVRSLARALDMDLEAQVATMRQQMKRAGEDAAEELQDMKQLESRLERLGKLRGAAFDRAYLKIMERSHEMAVENLSKAMPRVGVEAVAKMLEDFIPILEQHRALARSLQKDREGGR